MPREAKAYWDSGSEYKGRGERIYPDYHTIRLGKIKSLIDSVEGDSLSVVDVGCGEGDLLAYCLKLGWDVSGFDIAESMVKASSEIVAEHGGTAANVTQGGIDSLGGYEADSVDLLLAINVLTYLTDEKDREFYKHARRILAPGGTLIVAHSNELFDLFTMNRYTVEFFELEIIPRTIEDPNERATASERVRSLLTHPDRPSPGSTFSSQRDDLHKRRENPISYPEKLADFGFEQTDMLFTHYHAVPPLLFEIDESYAELGKHLEESMVDDPLRYMMASIFISKAVLSG